MKRLIITMMSILVLSILFVACGNEPTMSGNNGHSNNEHNTGDTSNIPFDALFIDSMIEHHEGAIEMAKQAQTQGEHQEIKNLADTIISTQQDEITKMKSWRTQWYPDLEPTEGMDMHMGDMEISQDTSKPFDQRFIDAMISHHQGAIDMANEAKQKAEHQEIKDLADDIITAQTKEIEDMKQWNQQWYGDATTPTPTHSDH